MTVRYIWLGGKKIEYDDEDVYPDNGSETIEGLLVERQGHVMTAPTEQTHIARLADVQAMAAGASGIVVGLYSAMPTADGTNGFYLAIDRQQMFYDRDAVNGWRLVGNVFLGSDAIKPADGNAPPGCFWYSSDNKVWYYHDDAQWQTLPTIQTGHVATRPAAAVEGRFHYAMDGNVLSFDNGSEWVNLAGLTVVSVAAIANPAAELATLDNVTSGNLLLARTTSAGTDAYTLYVWDNAATTADVPYVVAGAGGGYWVAVAGKYMNGTLNISQHLSMIGNAGIGGDLSVLTGTITALAVRGVTDDANDLGNVGVRYRTVYTNKLQKSANVALQIESDDSVSLPLQPFVHARQSTAGRQTLAHNTLTTLIFDAEVSDTANLYDNATGIFTAPTTGFYSVDLTVTIYGPVSGNAAVNPYEIYLFVAGAAVNSATYHEIGGSPAMQFHTSFLVQAAATDQILFKVRQTESESISTLGLDNAANVSVRILKIA